MPRAVVDSGMDAADTLDAVREAKRTELDRLGSDKLLVAVTGADMRAETIRSAAAARERGVAGALSAWADEVTESQGPVAAAFERAGAAARDRAGRIDAAPAEPDALSAHLDTVEGTAARVGAGLVAVPLVLDRFYLQAVGFFVNEADEAIAETFRALRSGAADLDPAGEALDALGEDERGAAREAAMDAVDVAYDDYAATLDGMGLDPRPIC